VRFYAGHPLATREGHRVGTLCIIDHDARDIDESSLQTLRKLAEIVQSELRSREELRRFTHDLEEANRKIRENADAKARFFAHMSHEIRTPMMSMLGYVDLIDGTDTKQEDRREYCSIVKSSGEHLLALINDILDHSKVEAGRMEVERIEISLPALLAEVEHLMRISAEQKGITLRLAAGTPVPATVRTDPVRLRQILVNLVGNAIKFTDSGAVEITVTLEHASSLAIEVRDTGVGMSPEQIDRIFEPFGQANEGITRRFGGTGLGLSISRQLASLLGGDIEADSEPGIGSRFTLRIDPGESKDIEMLDHCETRSKAPATTGAENGLPPLTGKVLVAEDNEVNRKLLRKILERYDLELETAKDGQVAVSAVLEAERHGQPFDLVLMDMLMPVVDGYAATSQLRGSGYRKPIVALTGNAHEDDREQCLRSGCDDFLTKPIDRAALERVLRRFLAAEPRLVVTS
jgi:signal transduction histidine kinase/ActR/RegA family two-component response regulator